MSFHWGDSSNVYLTVYSISCLKCTNRTLSGIIPSICTTNLHAAYRWNPKCYQWPNEDFGWWQQKCARLIASCAMSGIRTLYVPQNLLISTSNSRMWHNKSRRSFFPLIRCKEAASQARRLIFTIRWDLLIKAHQRFIGLTFCMVCS